MQEKEEAVAVSSRRRVRLAGLPAERVVIDYRNKGDELRMKKEMVAALRVVTTPQGGTITIEYLIDLVTTESRYSADRRTYEGLLSTWKLEPSMDGS